MSCHNEHGSQNTTKISYALTLATLLLRRSTELTCCSCRKCQSKIISTVLRTPAGSPTFGFVFSSLHSLPLAPYFSTTQSNMIVGKGPTGVPFFHTGVRRRKYKLGQTKRSVANRKQSGKKSTIACRRSEISISKMKGYGLDRDKAS